METRKILGKSTSGIVILALIPSFLSALFFLIFSLIIFLGLFQSFLHRNYISTTAKIVDIVKVDYETYYPIYEFDYNGVMVKVEGSDINYTDDLSIGSEVNISYDPNNYNRIEIKNKESDKIAISISILSFVLSIINIRQFIFAIKSLKEFDYNFFDYAGIEVDKDIEINNNK